MATMELAPYSGYRPRSMRYARKSSSGDAQKSGKRGRLSPSAQDRMLFCSAKGHKINPKRFEELSNRAKNLNGWRTTGP